MQIHIHKPHLEISATFESDAKTRIEDVLAPFGDWLTRVDVHLKDENAHKGGVDTRCVIEARPRGLSPVTAEHTGEGIRDAFHEALDKLYRVLDHQIGRLSKKRPD